MITIGLIKWLSFPTLIFYLRCKVKKPIFDISALLIDYTFLLICILIQIPIISFFNNELFRNTGFGVAGDYLSQVMAFCIGFLIIVPSIMFLIIDSLCIYSRSSNNIKAPITSGISDINDLINIAYSCYGKLPLDYRFNISIKCYIYRMYVITAFILTIILGFLPYVAFSKSPGLTAIIVLIVFGGGALLYLNDAKIVQRYIPLLKKLPPIFPDRELLIMRLKGKSSNKYTSMTSIDKTKKMYNKSLE